MADVVKSHNKLISIITPVYESEGFIKEAIDSVLNQTYDNWELLLVDDCSPDNCSEIIAKYIEADNRIKYFKLSHNSGAAIARNTALEQAKGRYIAFLDADDIWLPNKLQRQIEFMEQNGVVFSCCDYEKINADGSSLHKVIHMPKAITYEQLLRNTIIQTVGVIIDTAFVDRSLIVMPNIRRGQDSATWLQLLRNDVKFKGQNEVLAKYRRAPHSLSSNKLTAMKRTWHIYRGVEKLSIFKSIFCLIGWAYHATLKRIYIKNIFSK